MIQRLLLLCALAALSAQANALGLGQLQLNSALNQEFNAEIELTNVRGLEVQEILPGLASQADFARVGIERTYLLTDLRFKVVTKPDGRLFVQITSTRPIIEPFLNFIVEVLWPSGRILREYTVLLDPPVFGEEGVQALQPAQTQQGPAAVPAPRKAPAQARRESAPSSRPAAPARDRLQEGSAAGDEYGMTGPGDTLWAIAMKVRPNDSVSVQQMMLALQRANPDAFINNNINLLKAGHVLRIPDMGEIRRETIASAVQAVRTQNQEFEAYRGGARVTQLDATRRQPEPGTGPGTRTDGELRLLASESGRSGDRAGAGGDARAEALENELMVAREDLDRARRANTEMNVRLDDLEAQIETLNEIVKLKDDQLAALRAEVQRLQAADAAAPAAPAPQQASQDSLLTNPIVLGLLGLLVVAGAAGGLIFMRRRQQAEEFGEEEFETIAAVEQEPEEEEPEVDVGPVEVEEEEEDVSPQTEDVISEAEIYIAYGRFPQAVTFLQNAIEAEPDRADLQLKLLEVYVQTEDATAFNLQLEQLKQLGDDQASAQALELQQKIPGAAETAAASMDATIVASEPITAIDEPDDDDDLSFDLDDLDAETEEESLDLSDDLDLEEDAEELDLDLDLDLDEDTATGAADESMELGDELDLDLAADSAEEELDLDLDLDAGRVSEDDATVVLEAPEVEEELDLELDLGDDDDGAITLDEADLDDADLDLSLSEAASEAGDELALDDDDAIELDLDADADDAIELDLAAEADDTIELDLDADDTIELDLDADDDSLDLDLDVSDDNAIELDLGDDTELDLDLDDDALDLNLDDDDLELNLDEDPSTKLDLARAYIDMGDSDGARNVLSEVIKEGSDDQVQEANELLAKID